MYLKSFWSQILASPDQLWFTTGPLSSIGWVIVRTVRAQLELCEFILDFTMLKYMYCQIQNKHKRTPLMLEPPGFAAFVVIEDIHINLILPY